MQGQIQQTKQKWSSGGWEAGGDGGDRTNNWPKLKHCKRL